MKKTNQISYFTLILLHLVLGLLLFIVPAFSKVYSLLIIVVGVMYIVKTKNKNNEALFACAYGIGSEILLRMTSGNFIYEIGKYEVILFLIMGIMYKGFSKNSWIYWLFLIFLIPGIIYGADQLSFDVNVRKAILFNILGPISMAVSAIYCYDRNVHISDIKKILSFIALPIVSIVTYLNLYTPNIKDVVTGTSSNFVTSGGFGPNQMSTILGLGMICFFALFLLFSESKKLKIINFILLLICTYRGLVTFSRGGVITGLVGVLLLTLVIYLFSKFKNRSKILFLSFFMIFIGIGVWTYTSMQTSGLIEYRYANEDAAGREKKDRMGGREQISKQEINIFLDNPILGVGVGVNKQYREQLTGHEAASHNEVTRLLAEQGVFGVFCLLILLITPLFKYLSNKQHLLLLSFYFFWLLTINHAATRLAAPCFIYGLTLLKVSFEKEEDTLPRE